MNRLDLIQWIDLHPNVDSRGVLTAIEGSQTIPFEIKRVYFLTGVVADRAGHAHRETEQLIIPVAGSFEVSLSNGSETRTYSCDSAARGLYVVPMLFIRLSRFAPGSVALVLASTHYDKAKSIRTWEEYLRAIE